MIPAAFDYVRAGSADEAVALIAEHGEDAKFLAGGMSLLPLMKLRLATPSVLVDVGRVLDLSYVRDGGDHVAIGALTRHRDLETNDMLAKECGVVRAVAGQVGDNQVRHRGTIGGSVAHGDPASDLPAALLALDATFVVHGPSGARHVPAHDFDSSRHGRCDAVVRDDAHNRCPLARRRRGERVCEQRAAPELEERLRHVAAETDAPAGGENSDGDLGQRASSARRTSTCARWDRNSGDALRSAGGSVPAAASRAASAADAPWESAFSTAWARNGVGPMFTRPTCVPPCTRVATAPTIA